MLIYDHGENRHHFDIYSTESARQAFDMFSTFKKVCNMTIMRRRNVLTSEHELGVYNLYMSQIARSKWKQRKQFPWDKCKVSGSKALLTRYLSE